MTQYKTLNEITINSKSLDNNYNYFQKLNPQATVCPVLKSNAYGHGLIPVAEYVDKNINAPYIMVDSLYEAYELYKAKVKTPVMIMGYTDPDNFAVLKKLPFTFAVYDVASLLALNQYQPGAKIHIKIDTGMCRLGLQREDVTAFISVLKNCPNLVVEGIFSHFSQADDPNRKTFTNNQVKLFREMTAQFESSGFVFKYKHIAASAGAATFHDPEFNLIRLGLGFYGYSSFGPHTREGREQREKLQPVLSFTSRIALIKDIKSGSQVGYGGTYVAKQDERVAILTAGYADGVNRDLSNVASFEYDGIKCPVIGNISMNMTMIKLPRTISAKVGDQVVIISPKADSSSSVYRYTACLKTIPDTILTNLHPSTKRRII